MSGLDILDVTPARLATAATEIERAADRIDALLATLTSLADDLRSQWSGDAQRAFDGAEREFHASMASRTATVRAICGTLTALASAYSAADLSGARALGPEQ